MTSSPTRAPDESSGASWNADVAACLLAVHRNHKSCDLRRSYARFCVGTLAWLYLVSVVVVVLLMRLAGERWWFATILLFGPRWVSLLPFVALLPLACVYHRRSLLPLLAAAAVSIGPLMGFCLPWGRIASAGQPAICIFSCNVKGHCFENTRLDKLVRQDGIDIVVLQGCQFLTRVDWPADWNVFQKGELVFASRFTFQPIELPADPDVDNREKILICSVHLPCGKKLRLATVHLQSPHAGIATALNREVAFQPAQSGTMESESKQRWEESANIAQELIDDAKVDVVAGDFNLTEDNPIYRTYWSRFTNAFGTCGWGLGGTEWPACFPYGIRIDQFLTNGPWRPCNCWVGDDIGSDHAPILARIYYLSERR